MSKLCNCRYRAPWSYVEYLFKPKKFGRTTANYKGSEKEEKVSRDLTGFSLTLRPRKIQTFLSYYYYFFFQKKIITSMLAYKEWHVALTDQIFH